MSGAHFGGPGFVGPRSSFAAVGRPGFASFGRPGFSHFGRPGFAPGFVRPGFGPRFSHLAFHNHRFFFRHHHRFAFFGAPFIYAASYDSCWRRVWTDFGPRWVNVCDYGYGY
jgi:hypothetical protein